MLCFASQITLVMTSVSMPGCCIQDTYLLATQQEVTLAAELAAHAASSARQENGEESSSNGAEEGSGSSGLPTGATGLTRRRIFCHRLSIPYLPPNFVIVIAHSRTRRPLQLH